MVEGFKCFDKGLINRYGTKFEIGVSYHANGNIQFGNRGNGFHMCKNMEDTFRYFPATEEEVSVCYVKGSGNIDEGRDDYNEYYDMYAAENIEIIKKLEREEIINYALDLPSYRVIRFIQTFKLNNDEIELFKDKFSKNIDVINAISYYQLGDKEVYNRRK